MKPKHTSVQSKTKRKKISSSVSRRHKKIGKPREADSTETIKEMTEATLKT
jgi:hypothetical protein